MEAIMKCRQNCVNLLSWWRRRLCRRRVDRRHSTDSVNDSPYAPRYQHNCTHCTGQDAVLSPPHTDGSIGFARLRQCASISSTWYRGSTNSASQTASRSLQPFLHGSRQRVTILQHGPPFSRQNCPFAWRYLEPHLTHCFLCPPESTAQTTCRSVQPFSQGSWSWQIDRQTTLLRL